MPLDKWREFFVSSGVDIWTVINEAIQLAATDFPDELRQRRDSITEKLYSANQNADCRTDAFKAEFTANGSNMYHSEADKENEEDGDGRRQVWSPKDRTLDLGDVAANSVHERGENLYDSILALSKRISVPKIPESDLIESLSELEELPITVPLLKATLVGKTVKKLQKHSSRSVSSICNKILRKWKDLVDDWALVSAEVMVESNKREEAEEDQNEDNRGALPSPPLDEDAFLEDSHDMAGDQIDSLFRDLDELDNPDDSTGFNTTQESPTSPPFVHARSQKGTKPQSRSGTRSSVPEVNRTRDSSHAKERSNEVHNTRPPSNIDVQRKPNGQHENLERLHVLQGKEEEERIAQAAKRFKERYNGIEQAKRQRHIQVIPADLKKGSRVHKGSRLMPRR